MCCKMGARPCDALSWSYSTGSRHNANLHEKNNMTCERYKHIQNGTIQTLPAYFSSTCGRVNLHDDSFQSETPCT